MLEKLSQIFPGAMIQSNPISDTKYSLFLRSNKKPIYRYSQTGLDWSGKTAIRNHTSACPSVYISPEPLPAAGKMVCIFIRGWGNPVQKDGRMRFIHFSIDFRIERDDFLQAIHPLFHEGVMFIWIDETNGVFIETESPNRLTSTDFLSFTEALLSDFYYSISFYIGRFYQIDENIKQHFHREQLYFQQVQKYIPEEHVFSFETAFPIVLVTLDRQKIMEILHDEWMDIFQNDLQQLKMIKLFLENNSNVSLTARNYSCTVRVYSTESKNLSNIPPSISNHSQVHFPSILYVFSVNTWPTIDCCKLTKGIKTLCTLHLPQM